MFSRESSYEEMMPRENIYLRAPDSLALVTDDPDLNR